MSSNTSARSAGVPVADEAGGEHPGVVQHQAVPGAEEPGQVVEVVVADGAGGLIQGQQPGAVPLLQRGLGDQLRRQVVIKIFRLHKDRQSVLCVGVQVTIIVALSVSASHFCNSVFFRLHFFQKTSRFTLDEEKKLCYHEFQIIQMQDRGAALISIQGIRPGACSAMEKGCAAEGMLVSGAQRHLGVGLTALRLSPELEFEVLSCLLLVTYFVAGARPP